MNENLVFKSLLNPVRFVTQKQFTVPAEYKLIAVEELQAIIEGIRSAENLLSKAEETIEQLRVENDSLREKLYEGVEENTDYNNDMVSQVVDIITATGEFVPNNKPIEAKVNIMHDTLALLLLSLREKGII